MVDSGVHLNLPHLTRAPVDTRRVSRSNLIQPTSPVPPSRRHDESDSHSHTLASLILFLSCRGGQLHTMLGRFQAKLKCSRRR